MIAFDTETYLIQPGRLAPPLVCISAYGGVVGNLVGPGDRRADFARSLLKHDRIVGHNVAYDLAVLVAHDPSLSEPIWQAMAEGRIRDTMIRAQLAAIALDRFEYDPTIKTRPSFSLAGLSKQHLGEDLEKGDDTWRLRYSELADKQVQDWPEEAREYALKDAEMTYKLFEKLEELFGEPKDEVLQVRAAFGLHLMSCWGMITDPEAVEKLRLKLVKESEGLEKRLIPWGYLRVDRKVDGRCRKNLEKIRERVRSVLDDPPMTDKGAVKTDRETLLMSDDVPLKTLVKYGELEKQIGFVVDLKPLVQPRFHVLVRSGRTSCSRPNIQQIPRKGGVRECFVPRPGWLYVGADYGSIELCAFAEVCYELVGFSEIGNALAMGQDLHIKTGAAVLGMGYDEAMEMYEAWESGEKGDDIENVVNARQYFGKPMNYGYLGGLGVITFCGYYRSVTGKDLPQEDSAQLKKIWLSLYPEAPLFFRIIGDRGSNHTCVQLRSNRVRGGLNFTNGCNTLFQGLAADMAKDAAIWEVSRLCYLSPEMPWKPEDVDPKYWLQENPLSGSRPVAFIHDEILMESPKDRAEGAAVALSKVMEGAGSRWIRTVPIIAKAEIKERWSK